MKYVQKNSPQPIEKWQGGKAETLKFEFVQSMPLVILAAAGAEAVSTKSNGFFIPHKRVELLMQLHFENFCKTWPKEDQPSLHYENIQSDVMDPRMMNDTIISN